MKQILIIILCALVASPALTAQKKKDKKETVTFVVDGMDCQNCVKKIEKNIAFEKGVTDLKCDLPTKTAEVTYRTDKTDKDKLSSAFKKIGMEAVEKKADTPAK